MDINKQDISFIVQGPIISDITGQCLFNIRRLFPDAEIIVSTFKSDIELPKSLYDKIIINDDIPEQYFTTIPGDRQNNINKQIITVRNGLKNATKTYAFKIRTDFILQSDNFLKYFDLYKKSDLKYNIFKHKILCCTNFSRKTCHDLFHPSDIAFFGLRDDLINLFDIPLMTIIDEKYYNKNGYMFNKYTPEQHIFINCLNKNKYNINFNRFETPQKETKTKSEKYLVSNFILLSWKQFGLIPPQKFFDISRILDYDSCITHSEYIAMYKKYLDDNINIPYDTLREYFNKFIIKRKELLFFARIGVLPIFFSTNARRYIRDKIYEFLYKIFMLKLHKRICSEL